MEKWMLARHLIDAKKALDSLWFISEHLQELYNPYELCYDNRSRFYINTCAVLDNSVCLNGKKGGVCATDSVVKRIYTERDKYYAHKDKNYSPKYPYASIEKEAFSLQAELRHVRKLCCDYLPHCLTLDFVCYDGNLFRQINKILPADEQHINLLKYPLRGVPFGGQQRKVNILHDIDEVKLLSSEERRKYGVLFEDGLTIEEGLQKRQDSCIMFNALSGENVWVRYPKDAFDAYKELQSLGLFDKFGIEHHRIVREILFEESVNQEVQNDENPS